MASVLKKLCRLCSIRIVRSSVHATVSTVLNLNYQQWRSHLVDCQSTDTKHQSRLPTSEIIWAARLPLLCFKSKRHFSKRRFSNQCCVNTEWRFLHYKLLFLTKIVIALPSTHKHNDHEVSQSRLSAGECLHLRASESSLMYSANVTEILKHASWHLMPSSAQMAVLIPHLRFHRFIPHWKDNYFLRRRVPGA